MFPKLDAVPPKRFQDAFAGGLAKFEKWKNKFEAMMGEEAMLFEMRKMIATMPPQIAAMYAQQDPEGFEALMKVVKGE
jgi:hypothetical protein